jgi:hypothetical protein
MNCGCTGHHLCKEGQRLANKEDAACQSYYDDVGNSYKYRYWRSCANALLDHILSVSREDVGKAESGS